MVAMPWCSRHLRVAKSRWDARMGKTGWISPRFHRDFRMEIMDGNWKLLETESLSHPEMTGGILSPGLSGSHQMTRPFSTPPSQC